MTQTFLLDQCQLEWHLQDPDETDQTILLCEYLQERKRWRPTNYFLYGLFDQGWYKLHLKYCRLCFGFCKTEVPDSVQEIFDVTKIVIYHAVTIGNLGKKVPYSGLIFHFIIKIKVFKMIKRNISFYILKKKKQTCYKNANFARKEKVILWKNWESSEIGNTVFCWFKKLI